MTDAISQIKKNMVSITEILNKQNEMQERIDMLELEIARMKDEKIKLDLNSDICDSLQVDSITKNVQLDFDTLAKKKD
tara:strand:- start:98 stop:331 length:234 start_codon:yes stop_codon:yes gene_type:complete